MGAMRSTYLLFSLSLAPSLPAGQTVDVMSHGWHTGIVLPVNATTTELIPAFEHFQRYRWAEVSWGDEGFFRAKSISPGVTLRALLWPSPTVMHVDGFHSPAIAEYTRGSLVRLEFTDRAFRDLCLSIAADFASTDALSRGIYDTSYFFRAHGSYTLTNTCNVWTLRKLADAGLETRPRLGIRAEVAIAQIVDQGTAIRSHARERKWPYAISALLGLALAYSRRRRRAALDPAPEIDRHLRRAWGVVGGCALLMFLATLLVANHHQWARLIVRAALLGFTGGLATIGVVTGDLLRKKMRPLSLLQLLLAVTVIALVLSPM